MCLSRPLQNIELEIPSEEELKSRTEAVLASIYLLFNEGYNSTDSSELIRHDLIYEALYLCKLLAENKNTRIKTKKNGHKCFDKSDKKEGTNAETISPQNKSKYS